MRSSNVSNVSKTEVYEKKPPMLRKNTEVDFDRNFVNFSDFGNNNDKNQFVFNPPPNVIERSPVKEDGLGEFLSTLSNNSEIISSNQLNPN